jgi:hypothetical protein
VLHNGRSGLVAGSTCYTASLGWVRRLGGTGTVGLATAYLCGAQRGQEAPRPHRIALLVALAAGGARAPLTALACSTGAHGPAIHNLL